VNAYTLGDLVRYFLWLGSTGFGGPIALCGAMQRDLVDDRKWITKDDYAEGLALSQLAPGPLAAQLAIYLGWVMGGTLGATVVGIAFVLPSFLMVLAVSAAYVELGGVPGMQAAFYGVGAAVIGIIARSAYKLATSTVGKHRLLWVVFGTSALVTAVTETESAWLFVAAGMISMVVLGGAPKGASAVKAAAILPWPLLLTGLKGPATTGTLASIGWFFTKAGAFVFGSGLAIVPFLHGGVVNEYGWLDERQFLDAVAVAMITPGPVVITVAFIGYLVAGPIGATVAALATFLPCWLFTVLPAPYFRRFGKNRRLKAFVDGVTAAASGAIAGATFVLGRRAIVDVPTALLAGATVLALVYAKRVPEPVLILGAALVGIVLSAAGV
jgi:chromate transporter